VRCNDKQSKNRKEQQHEEEMRCNDKQNKNRKEQQHEEVR